MVDLHGSDVARVRGRRLSLLLRLFAVIEVAYFTASHWFFPRRFFSSLGIAPNETDSPFVRSQLQLIGAMVLGYALLFWVIAREPRRHRPVMAVVLAVGVVCTVIFGGNVAAGAVPPRFLVNAGLLVIQMAVTAWLFPWRDDAGYLPVAAKYSAATTATSASPAISPDASGSM